MPLLALILLIIAVVLAVRGQWVPALIVVLLLLIVGGVHVGR